MSNLKPLKPVKASGRIEVIDAWRGFAVMGIFVVNIEIMHCLAIQEETFAAQWTRPVDHLVNRILQLFFYTKFFPIFSLLFGLGISMQAQRLASGAKLYPFLWRRMSFLFLLGLVHITFLWSGDVLHLYAVLGLLVGLSLRLPPLSLVVGAIILLVFPYYDWIWENSLRLLNYSPSAQLLDLKGIEIVTIMRNGPWSEQMNLRWKEYLSNLPLLWGFLGPIALSMFWLGVYLVRRGVLVDLPATIARTKRNMLLLINFTNIYRIIFLFFLPDLTIYQDPTIRPILLTLMQISDVFMGLFYLWLIGWFWYFGKIRKLLFPLTYVGRMALTNYLIQSVFGVLLFTSVGLCWYETLSPLQTFLVSLVVFAFQVIYSKLWLGYFYYGPMEWIWRCFTYGRYLPITKIQQINHST